MKKLTWIIPVLILGGWLFLLLIRLFGKRKICYDCPVCSYNELEYGTEQCPNCKHNLSWEPQQENQILTHA